MIIVPAIVFIVTCIAYAVALKLFPALGLLDFPERYGLRRARLPYPTGIVAVLVFLALCLTLLPLDVKNVGMLAGVLLLALTCFIDDRMPLPSSVRLGIQLLIVLLIFATGSRIYTLTNPFGGFVKLDTLALQTPLFGPLPVLGGIFTVLWLLLTINALNWFDGIPGQVHTLATIGFLMLGLLSAFRNHEPGTAVLCFSLAAIAGAGLLFDFPPTRMLIGDTGSMFFGLLLGLIGVYQGGKVATVFLTLGLPLIDALFVITGRIMRGRSPLRGGRDHLHHLLLEKGWSERKIVVLTAVVGTAFGGGALFMTTGEKALAGVMLVILIAGLQWYIQKKY